MNGKFQNLQNGSGGDEYVVQQWTGLKDKDAKEIYEGDRVKFGYTENKEFFGEVVYFEDRATFGVKTKNADQYFNDLVDYMKFFEVVGLRSVITSPMSHSLIYYMKVFEVVGNIFQLPCNPDHNGECLVCDAWLDSCPFNVGTQPDIKIVF